MARKNACRPRLEIIPTNRPRSRYARWTSAAGCRETEADIPRFYEVRDVGDRF